MQKYRTKKAKNDQKKTRGKKAKKDTKQSIKK